MKHVHFLSGLPRSCSTLLCNLIAQNPRVHATATSPLHEIGYIARKVFYTEEVKSMNPLEAEKLYYNYVRGGCGHAFDEITDRPVVVDKCRSWIGHLDQTFKVWPNAKIIVPIRDVRGILTSMEKKRQNHPSPFTGSEEIHPMNITTIERRVNGWLSSPPIGIAIERLSEASKRFGNRLHFVHAEHLTENPEQIMKRIWEYLEEEPFHHDFNNVVQYTHEHEISFPYGDHTIRSKVTPLKNEWDEYLGYQFSQNLNENFGWINKL